MNKSNLAQKPSQLQQLLDQRRAALLQMQRPIKDHYVESIRVDFVAVLNRHFSNGGVA